MVGQLFIFTKITDLPTHNEFILWCVNYTLIKLLGNLKNVVITRENSHKGKNIN